MKNKGKVGNLCKSFLNLFKEFEFNVLEKTGPEFGLKPNVVNELERNLQKMLARAKKDLARAQKGHRAGKVSIEEVSDHEWRVHELLEELKRVQDRSLDDELK